mmetsp:Transcript_17528/g.31629  ORF Transcript_17528/g.31629 Transcript_17528/m.31629 type:complete len:682 (-) Transcript_17528:1485-3530(-)
MANCSTDAAVHPMVPVPDALQIVLEETAKRLTRSPVAHWEDVCELNQLVDGDHRILAQPVRVPSPGYPAYNASIMDGYAIHCPCPPGNDRSTSTSTSTSTLQNDGWTHCIVQSIYAGDDPAPRYPGEGEATQDSFASFAPAAYITTGAAVPDEYNCVIPIENCTVDTTSGKLKFTGIPKPGMWIRLVGCDMKADSCILQAGDALDAVAIGILVQLGVRRVRVRRRPKVGILSTGNELLRLGETPVRVGQIPDANRPLLLALLQSFGNCIPVDLGIQTDDDVPALAQSLLDAMDECDVIISTGGISMGQKDMMEHVLVNQLGAHVHFGRIHMKPGKPTTFLTLAHKNVTKLIFALPGNPVSAMVCSELFLRPCLNLFAHYHGEPPSDIISGTDVEPAVQSMLQSARVLQPEVMATIAVKDLTLDTERPEYHRVMLEYYCANDGMMQVKARSTGVQRSSRLMSCHAADGLMILPQAIPGHLETAKVGDLHPVLLLGNHPNRRRTRLQDSVHIHGTKQWRVSLIYFKTTETSHSFEVQNTMSQVFGSSEVTLVSFQSCNGSARELVDQLEASVSSTSRSLVNLHMVVCAPSIPFPVMVEASNDIRKSPALGKNADSMAMQARQGACSHDSISALFEPVVGYGSQQDGSLILYLPEKGLEGALRNIQGMMTHALHIGRTSATSTR